MTIAAVGTFQGLAQKLKQAGAAILLHLSEEVVRIFEGALNGNNVFVGREKAMQLIDVFANKLKLLNVRVFFACDGENGSLLELQITSHLGELIDTLDYQHENALIKKIFSTNTEIQLLCYFDSIVPLFDLKSMDELLEVQSRYLPEYSFGENLPAGIIAPFLHRSFLEVFEQNEETPLPDEFPISLTQYVEKNINKFHVEIHYQEPDLRMWRLDLSCKNLRSLHLVSRLTDEISDLNNAFALLEPAIQTKPELLYLLPSYLEIELISECDYACIFCPRQYQEFTLTAFSEAHINKVIAFLQESYADTVVALGGMGEPLQHEKVLDICTQLLDQEKLKALLIETNGFYLEKLLPLIAHKNFRRLRLVVNLNSLKDYQSLHGVDESYLEKVRNNLSEWCTRVKGRSDELLKNSFLQMLKINENENEIDEIFDYSEQLGMSFFVTEV